MEAASSTIGTTENIRPLATDEIDKKSEYVTVDEVASVNMEIDTTLETKEALPDAGSKDQEKNETVSMIPGQRNDEQVEAEAETSNSTGLVAESAPPITEDSLERGEAKILPSEPESKRPRLEVTQEIATVDEMSTEVLQAETGPKHFHYPSDAKNDQILSDEGGNATENASGLQDVIPATAEASLRGPSPSKVIHGRGAGTKLGSIPEVVAQFKRGKRSTPAIRKLHQILFSVTGNDQTRIDNILAWNGLSESDPTNILEKLNACMSSSELREIGRKVLGLVNGADGKDTKAAWSSAIADILHEPTPEKFHRFGATAGTNKARGPSGFQLFCGLEREKLKTENPSLSHRALMKVLGEKWRNISEEDKQNFQTKSHALRSAPESDAKPMSEGNMGTYSTTEETVATTSAPLTEDFADHWHQDDGTQTTRPDLPAFLVQGREELTGSCDGEPDGGTANASKGLAATTGDNIASSPAPPTSSPAATEDNAAPPTGSAAAATTAA